ncbi:hypothetical protein [Marinoscillum pacificum]|nr:hypothetical protein [Marinoscillum pacificum]
MKSPTQLLIESLNLESLNHGITMPFLGHFDPNDWVITSDPIA